MLTHPLDITHEEVRTQVEVDHALRATLLDGDIVQVNWLPEVDTVEKWHLECLLDVLRELGGGKKMKVYIDSKDFLGITKEAQVFAASWEGQRFTRVNAVLIDNAAKKLIFNFYLKVSRPKVHTRAFSNRESALAWLRQFSE